MCSVDRRRYRDGDFNGHWTSQLAPSQCSGILFLPLDSVLLATVLPPFSPLLSTFLSFFLFSRFTLLFTYLSVNLSSCVSQLRFFSLHRSAGLSSRSHLSLFLSFSLLVSAPKSNSRSICDLEGFRAEAGHYGPLSRFGYGNTENRGPILSAKKFIARSTLIGREIIGHSFSPFARSKRLSLIHDFSRIIAGSRHLLLFSSSSFVFLSKLFFSFFLLDPLVTSKHHFERLRHFRYIDV